MNKSNLLFLCAGALLALAALWLLDRCTEKRPQGDEVISIEETITEKADSNPQPKDSIKIKTIVRYLPTAKPNPLPASDDSITVANPSACDSIYQASIPINTIDGDSLVAVEIPITQTKYETENYRAYVSGYAAKLDSCIVFEHCRTVNIRSPTKPKRFSVGLQGGYGITPAGPQPYIGIGISVKLWSF